MENVIILQSYSSISYAVNLYYYLKDMNKEPYFIVFNNENISKFLHFIGIPETNIKFLEYSLCGYNFFSNKINFFKKIKEVKKICKNNVYIFNKNECIEIFDLFYRLEKSNLIKINYINFDPIIQYNNQDLLRNLIYFIKYKFYVKVPFKVSSNKNIIITEVDNSVLSRFTMEKIDFNHNYFKDLVKGTNEKVMVAEVDLIESGRCKDNFVSTNNKIYDILTYNFKVISVKPHPMFNNIYFDGNRSKIKVIEEYIPFEALLYDDNIEVVVGVMTTALINAAEMGKKVISTLEFYEFEQKNEIKEWLAKESKGRILFPKTFEEFEMILGVDKNDL